MAVIQADTFTFASERLIMRKVCAIVLLSMFCAEMSCVATMPPPPPPVGYVVPAQPHPDAVWMNGHWKWNWVRHRYVWIPGHWRLRRGHVWVIID